MSKFNLSFRWKSFFGIMCLLGVVIAILYLSNYPVLSWRDVAGFLIGSFYAVYYFCRLFDNLVLDENGFKYRSLGTLYSGKWSDVKNISSQRTIIPGLELNNEGVYITKEKLSSGSNWNTPKDFFVPLSRFVPQWQESVIKTNINKYLSSTKG